MTNEASDPSFDAIERLKRRADFIRVQRGAWAARPGLAVQCAPNPDRDAKRTVRLGFTATKKVGGAVVRNRARRRLREAAREILPRLARPGFDYVLVARAETPDRPFQALLVDLKEALTAVHTPRGKRRRGHQRPKHAAKAGGPAKPSPVKM
ncbi:MAG: ribonuclease P protein component [Pseudomonadota bacterium]